MQSQKEVAPIYVHDVCVLLGMYIGAVKWNFPQLIQLYRPGVAGLVACQANRVKLPTYSYVRKFADPHGHVQYHNQFVCLCFYVYVCMCVFVCLCVNNMHMHMLVCLSVCMSV